MLIIAWAEAVALSVFRAAIEQIVFAHIWLLLMQSSTIAHNSIRVVLPLLMFGAVGETLLRFIVVTRKRSWVEFL